NAFVFGKGVALQAWEDITGTYLMFRHPIEAAEGLAFAVRHPVRTWESVKAEWGSRSGVENGGRGTYEVVTVLGPGALLKVATAASSLRIAEEAAQLSQRAAKSATATARNEGRDANKDKGERESR